MISAVICSCPFSSGAAWTGGEAVRRAIAETDFVGVTGPVQVTFEEVGFRSGRELVTYPTVESSLRGGGCGYSVQIIDHGKISTADVESLGWGFSPRLIS